MMTWNLFIDDERHPRDVFWADNGILSRYHEEDWVIARNYEEALIEVLNRGFPSFVSFDHDLGPDERTGYDIAKQLVENDIISGDKESRRSYKFADDFEFFVHSQNPIGKANIEGLLNGYFKAKDRA
jgi:hypothetical protein